MLRTIFQLSNFEGNSQGLGLTFWVVLTLTITPKHIYKCQASRSETTG